MTVKNIGRGQYLVESRSHSGEENLVDLEDNEGVGMCECPDWKYRCYPNYLNAKSLGENLFVPKGKGRTLCKHILAAAWKDWKLFTVERSKQNNIQQA